MGHHVSEERPRRYVADLWAEWSYDEPAIRRTREALARAASQPPQDAPTGPETAEAVATPATAPEPATEASRGRVAQLVADVRAGDRAATEVLRRLLDG